MWNKSESEDLRSRSVAMPEDLPPPAPRSRAPATIGPSITIRGDLAGEEDLIIQGRVEGTISLHEHNVTVGKEGRIKASVHAKGVTVEGAVQGDLYSQEQVIVRSSGNVHGNITAPRVSLEDGCKFKGAIDMDVKQQEKRADTSRNIADIKPAPALKSDEVRKPAQNKPGHQASGK